MVDDEITDGRRIAELLASELAGRRDGELAVLSVADADRDVEPTVGGARAYDVERRPPSPEDGGGDGEPIRLARAFVHPDRLHLEFRVGREAAADAARDASLRVRPKATIPPRTLVFVERGAAVKRATDVLSAASRSVGNDSR